VEGTLFKVHRFFLERDSEGFRKIFESLPPAGNGSAPVVISPPGLVKVELEALLCFYYDGYDYSFVVPLTIT
jgi:hypothetical protein